MISTTKPIGSPSSPLTPLTEAPLELLQVITDSTLGNGHEEDASKNHHNLVSVFQEMVKDTDNSFRENTSPFYSKRLIERMIPDHLKDDIITKLYSSNALSASEAKSKSLFPAAFYHIVEAFGGAKTPAAFVHAPIELLLGEDFVGAFAEFKGEKERVDEMLSGGFVGLAIQILKDNPLHLAALTSDTKKINILLNAQKKYENPDLPPPLHFAVYSGNLEAVKLFVNHIPSMNYATTHSDYDHPVHLAIIYGYPDIVQEFIRHDPSLINTQPDKGPLLLDSAIENGKVGVLKVIMSLAPSLINVRNQNGMTALHAAAASGHIHVIKELMTQASSLANIQDHRGETALHIASEFDQSDAVKELLTQAPSLANVQDHQGETALHIAARLGHIDVVKELLTQAPSLANVQNHRGRTALHIAVRLGRINVVKELLTQAPSLANVQDHQGKTALHIAASLGRISFAPKNGLIDVYAEKKRLIDIVREFMTQAPSLANVQDHQGRTALHMAARFGHLDVVKELLTKFPSLVNVQDYQDQTVLHMAAKCSNVSTRLDKDPLVIKEFLTKFPSLAKVQAHQGRTALHIASEYGHMEAVKKLMKQFPFLINVRDQNGMTALHAAASSNRIVYLIPLHKQIPPHKQISIYPAIVQIFIDYSITTQNLSFLWLEDNAGKTPLDYAQRNNNFEINALLSKPALKPPNNDWSCQIL